MHTIVNKWHILFFVILLSTVCVCMMAVLDLSIWEVLQGWETLPFALFYSYRVAKELHMRCKSFMAQTKNRIHIFCSYIQSGLKPRLQTGLRRRLNAPCNIRYEISFCAFLYLLTSLNWMPQFWLWAMQEVPYGKTIVLTCITIFMGAFCIYYVNTKDSIRWNVIFMFIAWVIMFPYILLLISATGTDPAILFLALVVGLVLIYRTCSVLAKLTTNQLLESTYTFLFVVLSAAYIALNFGLYNKAPASLSNPLTYTDLLIITLEELHILTGIPIDGMVQGNTVQWIRVWEKLLALYAVFFFLPAKTELLKGNK